MNIDVKKMLRNVFALILLFSILIIDQIVYASEKAIVVIEFPSTVEAYIDYSGRLRWEWTTTFKETGGKVGYKVKGEGWIIEREGYRWGPINLGTIEVPPGGSNSNSFWCSHFCDAALVDLVGGYATFTWKGEDTNGNQISVTEKVNFTWQPTITASAGTGGKIIPSGQVQPGYKSSQTFTIIPDVGYEISDVKVDGSSKGPISTYTFTDIRCNHSISAYFSAISFTITATAEFGGKIEPSGSVSVKPGSSKIFTIIPDPGYKILDVKVDGKSIGAVSTYTFTDVRSNHSISATFSALPCIITATAGQGGTIDPAGYISVSRDSNQTFQITPNQGYEILDVKIDGSSIGPTPTYTFMNITENHTIEAIFKKKEYFIKATASLGGKIEPSGTVRIEFNKSQTFNIKPDQGYKIADVLVNGVSVGPVTQYTFNCTETSPREQTINAVFAQIPVCKWSLEGEIIVYKSVCDLREPDLSPQKGTIAGGTETTVTGCMTLDEMLQQAWALIVKIKNSANNVCDLIIPPPSDVIVNEGKTSNPAYAIYAVWLPIKGMATSIKGKITTSVDPNATVELMYIIPRFSTKSVIEIKGIGSFSISTPIITITSSISGIGGTINPLGSIKIDYGSDQIFKINPDPCYIIKDVEVNGKSVGAVNEYKFTNVDSNGTIKAIFEKKKYTITSDVSGSGGTIEPSGKVVVDCGSDQSFNIIPSRGYIPIDVKVDDVPIGSVKNYTFPKITSDHTITVIFGRLGDVNLDGSIKSNDAILVLLKLVEKTELTDLQKLLADVNCDGKINSVDAMIIQQIAIGMDIQTPYCSAPSDKKQIKVILSQICNTLDDNIIVPINIDSVDSIFSGDFCINYDDKIFSIVDVSSEQDVLQNVLIENNTSIPGVVHIAFASADPLDKKELVKLRFKTLNDVTSTSVITFKKCELYDNSGKILNTVFVNTKVQTSLKIPEHTELLQNFPNPSNPGTWIPFQLKEASEVRIKIFDIKGNLIRKFELGYKPAGIYADSRKSVYWDGTNEVGEKVSSGIYFYMIETHNYVATKKMIILR